MKETTVLILGGTGVMGTYLSKILSEQGQKVVVTSRKHHKDSSMIKYVQGDAQNYDFLKDILNQQWDTIVDFMVYSKEAFNQRFDLLLSSTNQYIYLSSARVYNHNDELITEESSRLLDSASDDEYLKTNEYALLKARQEDCITKSNYTNWTIIRPYITYGQYRLQLGDLEKEQWLYRAIKGRTIVFSKNIADCCTTMTHGYDVSKAIACTINNPDTLGQIYHITSEQSYKWSEVLDIYLNILQKLLGKRPKVLLQDMQQYTAWHNAVYKIKFDRLFDRKFCNKKISKHVNIDEFVELEQGLEACVNEFLKNPQFNKINWTQEIAKDKLTNEHTSISEIPSIKQKIKYVLYRYLKRW